MVTILCCGFFHIFVLTINTKMFKMVLLPIRFLFTDSCGFWHNQTTKNVLWTIRFLFTDACVLTCLSERELMLNNACIIRAAESITTQCFKFLISIQETMHIITVVLAAMGHLHGPLSYLLASNALCIVPCLCVYVLHE